METMETKEVKRMREPQKLVLSRRLQTIVEMVTQGHRVLDVGCDHGYVAIGLIQQGVSPHVIATDVRKGPLSRARQHIAERKLEKDIELRLSDGLSAYTAGEADTMVCAGMGGPLMKRILQEAYEKIAPMQELILQPQSELKEFRRFLREDGYRILDEKIVYEDGKFYFIFRVSLSQSYEKEEVCRVEEQQELYDQYGMLLLHRKDPVLQHYLQDQLRSTQEIMDRLSKSHTQRGQMRLEQIKQQREGLLCALQYYTRES